MDSTDVPPAFGMCTKIGNSSPSFFDCKFKSYLDVSLAYVSGGYAPKRARESDSEDDDAPKSPAIANVKPTAETTATMPFAAVFKFKDDDDDDDVLVLLFVAFSSASSNGARS